MITRRPCPLPSGDSLDAEQAKELFPQRAGPFIFETTEAVHASPAAAVVRRPWIHSPRSILLEPPKRARALGPGARLGTACLTPLARCSWPNLLADYRRRCRRRPAHPCRHARGADRPPRRGASAPRARRFRGGLEMAVPRRARDGGSEAGSRCSEARGLGQLRQCPAHPAVRSEARPLGEQGWFTLTDPLEAEILVAADGTASVAGRETPPAQRRDHAVCCAQAHRNSHTCAGPIFGRRPS